MDDAPHAMNTLSIIDQIQAAHKLYGHLTGQQIHMRYDRERMWYELLKAGFTLEDIRTVITYLQKEIRKGKRNVGALKISNLAQPDRFEEDLAISRVRLRPLPKPVKHHEKPGIKTDSIQLQLKRKRALELIQDLKKSID